MANRSFSLGRMSQSLRRLALLLGLAAVYFLAAIVIPLVLHETTGIGVELPAGTHWLMAHPRLLTIFIIFYVSLPPIIAGLIIAAIIYLFRRRK